jgi:hypothetical protein
MCVCNMGYLAGWGWVAEMVELTQPAWSRVSDCAVTLSGAPMECVQSVGGGGGFQFGGKLALVVMTQVGGYGVHGWRVAGEPPPGCQPLQQVTDRQGAVWGQYGPVQPGKCG